MVGQVGCLRVDFIAEYARPVEAELGLRAASEFGASREKGVVAHFLNDGELRARDMSGEELGAGFDGDDLIDRTGDDLRGDGNFSERVGIECGSDRGRDSEDGADARIAMRFGAFTESGLHGGIRFGESGGFGEKAGVLQGIGAHTIGAGRSAKVLVARKLGDAACEFDYGKSAKRKTGCADALGVDAGAKGRVGEELIEKGAQVVGALAPEDGAGDCVVFERIVAGMIYGRCDETVRGKRGAEPSHHGR